MLGRSLFLALTLLLISLSVSLSLSLHLSLPLLPCPPSPPQVNIFTGLGLSALLSDDSSLIKFENNTFNATANVTGSGGNVFEEIVKLTGPLVAAFGVGLLQRPLWLLFNLLLERSAPAQEGAAHVEIPKAMFDRVSRATELSSLFGLYNVTGSGSLCLAEAVNAYVDWGDPSLLEGGGGSLSSAASELRGHVKEAKEAAAQGVPACIASYLLCDAFTIEVSTASGASEEGVSRRMSGMGGVLECLCLLVLRLWLRYRFTLSVAYIICVSISVSVLVSAPLPL